MAVAVSTVIAKAREVLLDASGVRNTDATMLAWLNDGQRAVVNFKPNAYIKYESAQLVAGTRQSLPSDGVQLMTIVRNMGTTGVTPGAVVRETTRETMDAQLPTWHSTTAAATAKHFMKVPLDPKTFYVWPPQPSSNQGYIEVVYGALPPDATLVGSISVDDIYAPALVDYLLYRAFAKDSEFSADQGRSMAHFNAFVSALTGKARAESAASQSAPEKAE
jgi:hypothetical protein